MGTWLGTNKIYKLDYGESGATAWNNYATSQDNIYGILWNYQDTIKTGALWSAGEVHVNADYVSGDEDAIIDFNAGMATLKLEYLGTLGVRHFTLSERLRVNKSPTAAGDFDSNDAAWAMRIGQTMDFATWTLGTKYGITGWFEMENKLNDTTPELAALSAFNYSMTANSKAKVFGVDAYVLKQSPCVQANDLYGVSAIVCSDVDPGAVYTHGVGVRAFSGDMGDYTGVRQSPAFLAYGDRGWDYGFLYIDLNGTDVLCSINQSGLGYFAQGIEIAGDVGSGFAGRLRLTNGYTAFVDGTGSQAPKGVTGAGNPVFAGWVKCYTGESTIYLPAYTAIQ